MKMLLSSLSLIISVFLYVCIIGWAEESRKLWTAYRENWTPPPHCNSLEREKPRDLKISNPYRLWPDLTGPSDISDGKVLFGFYEVSYFLSYALFTISLICTSV